MVRLKTLLPMVAIVLMAASAAGQDAITVSWGGTWTDALSHTTYLYPGPKTITFTLTVVGNSIKGNSNGFRIYNQDGTGTFGAPTGTWNTAIANGFYESVNQFTRYFGVDGTGEDTVGFGGFTIGAPGIPPGIHNLWTISTTVVEGETFCLDTAYFPPGGEWVWATDAGDEYPDWYDEPYCLEVRYPPPPPLVVNCPYSAMAFNHCATSTYDFNAEAGDGSPVSYSMVSGIGSIDPVTGVWMYTPSLADVGPVHQVVIRAQSSGGASADCFFEVWFTNMAPTITCQGPVVCGVGIPFSTTITKNDVDCDTGSFSIVDVRPQPVGPYSIDPATGVLSYTAAPADDMQDFAFTVLYSDGMLHATCDQHIQPIDQGSCCQLRGDIDGNGSGPNISDLTMFVNVFFREMGQFLCDDEADVNDDQFLNISDLTFLVNYLFREGPEPYPCPWRQ